MSLPNASIDRRIKHVIAAAGAAGFDSLDSMMLNYYTASFGQDAGLVEIQHQSRRRGLHQLFPYLSERAQSWPLRECYSFDETVLTCIEQMVRREAQIFKQAQQGSASCFSAPSGASASSSQFRDKVRKHCPGFELDSKADSSLDAHCVVDVV